MFVFSVMCPRLFYQLYIIHSHVYGTVIPGLLCLLPDKKVSTYHRLFTLLPTKCDDLDLILDPKAVIVDFEFSVHNVVRSLFLSTMVNTWLVGMYPIDMWNQILCDVPLTNNNCDGYNSRLSKRAQKSHPNIYALIVLFRDEQLIWS